MKKSIAALGLSLAATVLPALSESGIGWVSYPGGKGAGEGKHIVLIAGDEEYRSEEAMPMLGKILSTHFGFQCSVLFSTETDGTINPNKGESIGTPEALDSADAIITSLRFRKWPDEAMKHFDAAIQRGVCVVAIRTSTHSFQLPDSSGFKQYNKYGRTVLGEGWVNHWGRHRSEATRAILEATAAQDPLLRGVTDVFVDSDVYEAYPPADAVILFRGQVLKGMSPTDPPAVYQKQRATDKQSQDINTPMMPIAWHREVKNAAGKTNKILCTTMGAATDLTNEGLRRMLVNGVFWGLGIEVPVKADVDLVGNYQPNRYEFDGYKKGLKGADFELAK